MDEKERAYLATLNPREKTDPDDIAAFLKQGGDAGYYTFAEAALSLADAAGLNLVHREAPEYTAGPPLIHRKIVEVMRAVSPVAKAGYYEQGKTQYNYRRADDVFDAIHPAMAEAGIYPKPMTTEVVRNWGTTAQGSPRMEITLRITYRFTAEDGSYEDVPIEIDNWNTSDKGIAAAHTVALRVALLQLFVIPTGDPDPDASREETGTAPPITPALTAYLVPAVLEGPLERLEELYGLLEAHVAPDTRIPGDEAARVWWEVWAARYVAEIEAAAHSKEAMADLWRACGPFGRGFRIGEGRQVGKALIEAGMRWSDRQKLAIDEVNGLIHVAEDRAALDLASEVIKTHLKEHRIESGDSLLLLEVLEKKRVKVAAAEAEAARVAIEDPDYDHDAETQHAERQYPEEGS